MALLVAKAYRSTRVHGYCPKGLCASARAQAAKAHMRARGQMHNGVNKRQPPPKVTLTRSNALLNLTDLAKYKQGQPATGTMPVINVSPSSIEIGSPTRTAPKEGAEHLLLPKRRPPQAARPSQGNRRLNLERTLARAEPDPSQPCRWTIIPRKRARENAWRSTKRPI